VQPAHREQHLLRVEQLRLAEHDAPGAADDGPDSCHRADRVDRRNSTRRSAVRKAESASSTVQQAPPMAASRMAVTRPPWMTVPLAVGKPYSAVASQAIVVVPEPQLTRR
jgi:hypothetical protein